MTDKAAGSTAGAAVSGDELTVRADADKLFFIEMLVKDIELIPAILDLADNSVDSARKVALAALSAFDGDAEVVSETDDGPDDETELPDMAFDGLRVQIEVSPDSFVISDNCAGIDLNTARLYAFRFGRPKKFEGVPGSVGEFGVGMKRALFKMGRTFSVRSRSVSEVFDLDVDVDAWITEKNEDDWTFKFASATKDLPPPSLDERGTTVTVGRLHESVSEDFRDELVLSLLRQQLRLRHHRALDLGLEIWLNGDLLQGLKPTLMSGPNFQPVKRAFVVDDKNGSVTVELIAGIVLSDKRDISQNDGRAEAFKTPSESGWWVFCNNRLLLVADKTPDTGWGNGAASYHPQYRLFRGYVYMSSLDTSLLPWNTTKTGVDLDSRIWRQVQSEMLSALVEVQAVINRLKIEREQLAPDDRDEALGDEAAPYTRALQAAKPIALRELPRSASVVVPPAPTVKRAHRKKLWQRLQFDVPRDQFDEAMAEHEFSTATELGRTSFDYFYKREVKDR